MRILSLALALFLTNLPLASADEVNDFLTRNLYAGTLADGQRELLGLVQSNDKSKAAEASAAHGIVKFAISIEKLGQAFHRHGLETPQSIMIQLPIMRLPPPRHPLQGVPSDVGVRICLIKPQAGLQCIDLAQQTWGGDHAALPLFVAGLGAMGQMSRRKKRKAAFAD
jgi:hypothetical protein